jgi:hypothetical protein
MSSGRFDLAVGTDLWFEGALWRVHRIDTRGVELVSDRTATRVPFDRLLAEGRPVNEAEPRDADRAQELTAMWQSMMPADGVIVACDGSQIVGMSMYLDLQLTVPGGTVLPRRG